jgi:hypothetical protein
MMCKRRRKELEACLLTVHVSIHDPGFPHDRICSMVDYTFIWYIFLKQHHREYIVKGVLGWHEKSQGAEVRNTFQSCLLTIGFAF